MGSTFQGGFFTHGFSGVKVFIFICCTPVSRANFSGLGGFCINSESNFCKGDFHTRIFWGQHSLGPTPFPHANSAIFFADGQTQIKNETPPRRGQIRKKLPTDFVISCALQLGQGGAGDHILQQKLLVHRQSFKFYVLRRLLRKETFSQWLGHGSCRME